MTPKEAMERVKNGEDLGNGPHKIPAEAREVMCYFKGRDGDEITAWFNGAAVESKPLRFIGISSGYGEVVFAKPTGATTLTTNWETRQALFE